MKYFLMRVLDFVMGQISNIGPHFIADTKPLLSKRKKRIWPQISDHLLKFPGQKHNSVIYSKHKGAKK